MYSDAVLDAQLSDIEYSPAFLLGLDLAGFCNAEEYALVNRFLSMIADRSSHEFGSLLRWEGTLEPAEERLSSRLSALREGLNESRFA